MKKEILQTWILSFAALFLLITSTTAAAGSNAVNLGVSATVGPDTSATLVFVEYERMQDDNLAILGRIGSATSIMNMTMATI